MRLIIWLLWNGLWLLICMIIDLLLFRLVICVKFGSGSVLCVVVNVYMLYILWLEVRCLWNLVL